MSKDADCCTGWLGIGTGFNAPKVVGWLGAWGGKIEPIVVPSGFLTGIVVIRLLVGFCASSAIALFNISCCKIFLSEVCCANNSWFWACSIMFWKPWGLALIALGSKLLKSMPIGKLEKSMFCKPGIPPMPCKFGMPWKFGMFGMLGNPPLGGSLIIPGISPRPRPIPATLGGPPP